MSSGKSKKRLDRLENLDRLGTDSEGLVPNLSPDIGVWQLALLNPFFFPAKRWYSRQHAPQPIAVVLMKHEPNVRRSIPVRRTRGKRPFSGFVILKSLNPKGFWSIEVLVAVMIFGAVLLGGAHLYSQNHQQTQTPVAPPAPTPIAPAPAPSAAPIIPPDASSGLSISATWPVKLRVTDTMGQRQGEDSSSSYNEISSVSFNEGSADSKFSEIAWPTGRWISNGSYDVKITGTATGTYELSVSAYDKQGSFHTNVVVASTTSGQVVGTKSSYLARNLNDFSMRTQSF